MLVLGDAQTPDWSDWPIYVAAFAAQLALALSGRDRDEVLSMLVELLAARARC